MGNKKKSYSQGGKKAAKLKFKSSKKSKKIK